jgi:hypothetical protein
MKTLAVVAILQNTQTGHEQMWMVDESGKIWSRNAELGFYESTFMDVDDMVNSIPLMDDYLPLFVTGHDD